MNKYSFNQISLIQFILIICEAQVGIGVLSLPRDLAKKAGTDGWMGIIIGWMLAMLLSLIIIRVMEKNPGYTIFEIVSKYFGKWGGKGITLLWSVAEAYIASTILFSTIHIIKIWILQNVSNYILMILLIIPIYMVTKHGIRMIGMYAELVCVFTMWMPLLLLFALKDTEWMYLFPIGKEGILPILDSAKSTVLSFLGFELAFILYPFLKDKKSAAKGIVIANSLTMLVYLTTTLVSFIRFSPLEITDYLFPVLNLLKVIHLPFMERLEIVSLSFYLALIIMSVIPSLYVSMLGISQLLGKQDHRNPLRILLFLWVIASFFYIPSAFQIMQMVKSWVAVGIIISVVFPIFLWIYGWLFHFVRKEAKQ
ncbi:hypothetical protein A8709_04295 [Paenibacillus pectinilyticus]|uniref:Uncharacterized protein n=1 Tax=Paenibacillus pectinilyticus TaxID=512399 RepID=A0A1C0ZS74_9BACL|nr:endospore germination permease [Paenibacillus pectinilyticus]OCT10931.1 hypothetical protein A8709_04295 [Paenibacillus pectinilyticus]